MCIFPGDFKVDEKESWVRKRLLPRGSRVPGGNVLSVYLDACKRLQVSAVSGVVQEINRRKCSMQPLPYHVMSGKTKAQKIHFVLAWINVEDTDGLSWKIFRHIIAVVAPLMTDEDLQQYNISPTFEGALLPMAVCEHVLSRVLRVLPPAEAEHALLEVLCTTPPFEVLPRTAKFRAAFRFLDVDLSEGLSMGELKQLLPWIMPQEEDSISSGPARDLLHRMDTNGDADADMSEFVRFMESALEGVPDQTIDQRICSLLESRVAGRFQYDFSGLYCGYRGVSAIVAALAADITFESIDLSGCGVNNTGVKELAEVLKTHPAVRMVRLSNNPISAEGLTALAAMLEANPSIVEVDVSGNHCERNFSHVHYCSQGTGNPALEPAPGTLAQTAFQKNLKLNQDNASSAAAETLACLRAHSPELHHLFTSLMDAQGNAALSALRTAVADAAGEWGLNPEAVKSLICPESLFTGVLEVNADDSGEIVLSRHEFLHALDARSSEKRVCRSVQLNLVDIKAAFYQLTGPLAQDSQLLTPLTDAAEDWSSGTLGEGPLFGPPFASHAIDPALFGSHSGEVPPLSGIPAADAAQDTVVSDSAREEEVCGISDHVDALDGDDAHAQEATQEYSLRGGLIETSEMPEELPLDDPVDAAKAEDSVLKDACQLPDAPMLALPDGHMGDGYEGVHNPDRVLVVFEIQDGGQQEGTAEGEGEGQCTKPFGGVRVGLYINELPDPTADDPSTPPLAQNAVRIEEVFEIMKQQVQDPARGWGVLMSDVRKVLTPERFRQNAGSRCIPQGYVTWPVFVRTVLHLLHR